MIETPEAENALLQIEQLKGLLTPFGDNQISKLPKQDGWMKDKKNEYRKCDECGGYHHPKAIHLDYVGHAALTARLLEVDPMWFWEPFAINQEGLPAVVNGQMWIRLTVCGMTRIGIGDAQGKQGPNATKEMIGDALRNAGMRFGMALDLWHKGDLYDADKAKGSKSTDASETKQSPGACKKNGSKNPDWKGPLGKDALWQEFNCFMEEFEKSDHMDNCKDIYGSNEFKAFRAQAEEDWGDLLSGWKGVEGEWNTGIKQAYQGRMRELMQLAEPQ